MEEEVGNEDVEELESPAMIHEKTKEPESGKKESTKKKKKVGRIGRGI